MQDQLKLTRSITLSDAQDVECAVAPKHFSLWNGCSSAGCAAKANPVWLRSLLDTREEISSDESDHIGINSFEDVGTVALPNGGMLVMNTDMIAPVIDDGYVFGQVAAAHALSDLYAKGVSVRGAIAMDTLCYPARTESELPAREILHGVRDKLAQAGAHLVGGHTMQDTSIKLGLTVAVMCPHTQIMRNNGARPTDVIVITKPLGTGYLTTALKNSQSLVSADQRIELIRSMTHLNEAASCAMTEIGASAATDVTGFGLAGHLYQILVSSGVSAELLLDNIPLLTGVTEIINAGIYPRNLVDNEDLLTVWHDVIQRHDSSMGHITYDTLFCPETSGGLLITVPANKAKLLIASCIVRGVSAQAIGMITTHSAKPRIVVRSS